MKPNPSKGKGIGQGIYKVFSKAKLPVKDFIEKNPATASKPGGLGKKKKGGDNTAKAALNDSIQVKKVRNTIHRQKIWNYSEDDNSLSEAESSSSSDSDIDDVSFWD